MCRFLFVIACILGVAGLPRVGEAQQIVAQLNNIAGYPVYCVDATGTPVAGFWAVNFGDGAFASRFPTGQPFIFLDPGLQSLPPVLQAFMYAHECGHHVLGHALGSTPPIPQVDAEADCWAIKTGRNQGWLQPNDFQLLFQLFHNNPGNWTHFPGGMRLQIMMQCYQTP